MNTTTTRRRFLSTASAAIAAPGLLVSAPAESKPVAWTRSDRDDWPRLAGDLAQREREELQNTYPGKWHRINYVTVNAFRPGTSLVIGIGRISEAKDSHAAIVSALVAKSVEILAVGWSSDCRAWSLFAEANADLVKGVMPGSVEFFCSVCNAAWPQFTEYCPRCKTHWNADGTGLKDFPLTSSRSATS